MTVSGCLRISDLLQSAFPELAVDTIEFLGEGDFCRAFLLNHDLVLRLPKHDEAARALEREACVLPLIAPRLPAKVPVPATCMGRTSESERVSISVHSHVPGIDLTADEWEALPAAAYHALARQLGEFFAALHALPPELVSECGVTTVDHHARAVRLLDELARSAEFSEGLRAALGSALSSYIASGPEWSYRPALLNTDVSPGHVLVDLEHSRVAGVIDWGDVCIGDPARDFIFLYEDWKSPFLRHVVDAYGADHPEAFLQRVLQHYLMDQLAWTLVVNRDGRDEDFHDGARALEEVADVLSSS